MAKYKEPELELDNNKTLQELRQKRKLLEITIYNNQLITTNNQHYYDYSLSYLISYYILYYLINHVQM